MCIRLANSHANPRTSVGAQARTHLIASFVAVSFDRFDRVYIVLHQVLATQTTRACRERANIKPLGNASKFFQRQITRYLIKLIFTSSLRFPYSFAYL